MVVGVFGLIVVILHRGNAVLKATQTAAEHWCGFPQLDGVLTVYAALYDVAVCGQVLNTVCNEGGQQLIAQLDTAVLCTGVGGGIDRHARLIAGDVEEHELAVLGHGEGNIVIRGGICKVGFVILHQIVGVFVRNTHVYRRGGIHTQRVVAGGQVRGTAEIALGAEGVRTGDIECRDQIDGDHDHDTSNRTDQQLALICETFGQLAAHADLEQTGSDAADYEHDHRQGRAGDRVTEALDRYRADD